jgi:succinate dehydrogenase/fumarate reductase flavoprotein subunit
MDSKGDYAGKRKGQQLAEKYKKFSPEEIEKQKKLEAERNKPKREVKSFETDKETVENQKAKIIGTNEEGAKDAKDELKEIEEEQKKNKPKREVRTFESDGE